MSREDPENGGARAKNNNTTTTTSSSFLEELSERHWTSWLIPMFVVANVVMFIIEMFANNCPKSEDDCFLMLLGKFSFQPLRENPLFGPSSTTLEKLGALEWSKIVYDRQGWRLFTCIWLHAGVVHLLANMLSLVPVGIRLEQQFGFVRIGIIYLLSGFGGSVLSCLFIRNAISVGASGAVFGLLGAMLSELITNWSLYKDKAGAVLTLLIIVAINLAIGILPHVDNISHIGGFMTGFLLGFMLLPRPRFGWTGYPDLPSGVRLNSNYKPYQYVMWLLSLILLIAGFAVALMMLFRGENGNDHCSWCHYLSCIPTSRWNCGKRL